jgi:hypothetical protein
VAAATATVATAESLEDASTAAEAAAVPGSGHSSPAIVPQSMARLVREAQVHAERRVAELEQRSTTSEAGRVTAVRVAAGLYRAAVALRERLVDVGGGSEALDGLAVNDTDLDALLHAAEAQTSVEQAARDARAAHLTEDIEALRAQIAQLNANATEIADAHDEEIAAVRAERDRVAVRVGKRMCQKKKKKKK